MRTIAGLVLLATASVGWSQKISSQTFGGSGSDTVAGITVDSAGNIYVVGTTTSFDLPVRDAYQPANSGSQLVFSPDAGVTWQALPNIVPPPAVGFVNLLIAADPGNPDGFYAASANHIFRTIDRGRHFTTTDIPSSNGSIVGLAVDPSNSNTVYVNVSLGILKSTDGGKTWTNSGPVLPAQTFISSVVVDPLHPKSVWVWAEFGGFVSTDAGATWRATAPISNGGIGGNLKFLFDAVKPGVVYGPALGSNGRIGLQKSGDGGLTWTVLDTPFNSTGIVADPVRSGWLYTIVPPQTYMGPSLLYRSTDGAATWQALPGPPGLGRLAIDPASPDILVAGLFRSVDGGLTWSRTPVSRDITAVFAPSGKGILYAVAPLTADVFLAKYLPDGRTLVFATYFGGMGNESAAGVKLDPAGNVWIAGTTSSYDFPVLPGAFQSSLTGASNGFVAELSPDGVPMYSSYIGSSGTDAITGLAVDSSGAPWITGQSSAFDFPSTTGRFPGTSPYSPATYVFAAKLDAAGGGLAFSSFIGGSNVDRPGRIALDPSDNAIITGTTYSADFPLTPGAYHSAMPGSFPRVFVVKLDSSGSTVFSTYFGGVKPAMTQDFSADGGQSGAAVTTDGTGNIYVSGNTGFTDFPTTGGAYQTALHGGCTFPESEIYTGFIGTIFRYLYDDVFVSKLSADGSSLLYSTLLGGACYDRPSDLAVSADGTVYVAGETDSLDFPLFAPIEAAPSKLDYRSFVSALDPTGANLNFSTYLTAGASPALALAPDGRLWIGGAVGTLAQSSTFQGGPQGPANPLTEAYVAVLDLSGPQPALNLTGVLNGFSLLPGPIAPGEIVALAVPSFQPVSPNDIGITGIDRLSDTLGGAQVFFNDEPAQIISISEGRIVCIAPLDLVSGQTLAVHVLASGAASNLLSVPVSFSAPGLLSLDGSGMGAAAARNVDGSLNGPDNPADRGSMVTVYLTGKDPNSSTVGTSLGNVGAAPLIGFIHGIFSAQITIPQNVSKVASISVSGQVLTIYVR